MTGKKKAQEVLQPKEKKKIGRPTKYTPELGEEICDAIASSELGLVHLVDSHPHWPHRATIFIWMRKHPEFRDMYTRAKEDQVEVSVEHMQEIMNEPHKYEDLETGFIKLDHNMLRLKMDAIKWQASKLKPRKFGDAKVEEANNDLHEDVIQRKHDLDERNKKEF